MRKSLRNWQNVLAGITMCVVFGTTHVIKDKMVWDGLSSAVGNISIAIMSPSMPDLGFFCVTGVQYDDRDGIFGITEPRDAYNNCVSENSNWAKVTIKMNTSSSYFAYWGITDKEEAMKWAFTHEVGHALKLKHPVGQASFDGHTQPGGYPTALMNSGYLDNSAVSTNIELHDISNLRAKWGR